LLGNGEAANKQAKRVARLVKVDADEKGFCNKSTRKKPLKLSFSAQLCQKMHAILEPYSEVEERCRGKAMSLAISLLLKDASI